MKTVIAITGHMGAGKSTMAKMLAKKYGAEVISLADPLKEFARALGWNGEKDKRGRRLLQLLGTEVGRECISKDIWASKWVEAAEASEKNVVICDDLRFTSEYLYMREHFYEIAFIHIIVPRPWWKGFFRHKSEAGVAFLPFDGILEYENTGSLEDLQEFVDGL